MVAGAPRPLPVDPAAAGQHDGAIAGRLPLPKARHALEFTCRYRASFVEGIECRVQVLVGVATEHPDVRDEAITSLLTMLAWDDTATSTAVEQLARNLFTSHPDLVRHRLVDLVAQDNHAAASLLAMITDPADDSQQQHAAAMAAATHLGKPLTNTATRIDQGTGAPRQAILAASLPADERRDLAAEQLRRAASVYERGSNRPEYLEAARILAHDLDQVDSLFDTAMTFATDPSPCRGDLIVNVGNHPLSTF